MTPVWIAITGIETPEREVMFAKCIGRKWKFDYAWPSRMLALEYEGGVYVRGRHVRPKGYEADCEKYSRAAILGWLVVRVTPGMVRDGRATALLAAAMEATDDAC